ncbi:unnamed protein product [Caenorhabditis brenneri]
MSSLYLFFPQVSWKPNQESGVRALIFMSNRARTAEEDYFQMLSIAIDIFTHTWSLSVEVQFYAIIPLVYILGERGSVKFQFCYYFILGAVSFYYSLSVPPSTAFNSVFARVWQFFIGFLVQLYSSPLLAETDENGDLESEKLLEADETDESPRESGYRIFPAFLALGLVLILFFPVPLNSEFVRPLNTICTGLVILVSDSDQKLLSNRVLIYFGDISYALYLVHWPIYAYWKLTRDEDHIALLLALIASIACAVVIHETFEKWYLQQSLSVIGVLSAVLFILSAVLIKRDGIITQFLGYQKNYSSFDNITLDDAAHLNHQWNLNDYRSLFVPTCHYEGVNTPFGWCTHSKKGLTGDLKIMIIGNSWAANHASMFYEECGHLAKSLVQGAASACEPLYPTRLSEVCKSNFTDFEDHIRKEKPDYVFMFTRFVTIGDPSETSSGTDLIYQIMKKQMEKFTANIRYKLYILHAMPRPNIEYIEEIVPMIRSGKSLEFIDDLLVNHTLYKTARRRYTQFQKDCNGKCVLVDYNPEFWNEESQNFRFFDKNGLSYFTTTTHLTPRGIEHVRHVWRDICRGLKNYPAEAPEARSTSD